MHCVGHPRVAQLCTGAPATLAVTCARSRLSRSLRCVFSSSTDGLGEPPTSPAYAPSCSIRRSCSTPLAQRLHKVLAKVVQATSAHKGKTHLLQRFSSHTIIPPAYTRPFLAYTEGTLIFVLILQTPTSAGRSCRFLQPWAERTYRWCSTL